MLDNLKINWVTNPTKTFPNDSSILEPETLIRKRVLTYMKPEDFLKLAEKIDFNSARAEKAFKLFKKNTTGLSVPFLGADKNKKGQIEICYHEGRHRVEYARRIDPDTLIPVFITLNQQTSDILTNADFINQEGELVDVKIFIKENTNVNARRIKKEGL